MKEHSEDCDTEIYDRLDLSCPLCAANYDGPSDEELSWAFEVIGQKDYKQERTNRYRL